MNIGLEALRKYVLYFKFTTGEGKNVTYQIGPGNLISFSNKRVMGGGGNTFNLSLIGDMVTTFEYSVVTGSKQIEYTYGWEGEVLTYKGTITKIDTKFEDMLCVLHISGTSSLANITTSVSLNDKDSKTRLWKKGLKAKDIISTICKEHKWRSGLVTDSKPLSRSVVQSNETDLEFLENSLSQEIETSGGISDYKLWLSVNGSQVELNYAPMSALLNAYSKDNFIYDMYSGKNSNMLSFELNNSGDLIFNVGTTISSATIDSRTNKITYQVSDGVKNSLKKLYSQLTGSKYYTEIFNNSNASVLVQSTSSSVKLSRVGYYWAKMFSAAFKATAEVVGNMRLNVGTCIPIVVVLSDGRLHYSSGYYNITEVEDTIDTSGFISKLSLIKSVGA